MCGIMTVQKTPKMMYLPRELENKKAINRLEAQLDSRLPLLKFESRRDEPREREVKPADQQR